MSHMVQRVVYLPPIYTSESHMHPTRYNALDTAYHAWDAASDAWNAASDAFNAWDAASHALNAWDAASDALNAHDAAFFVSKFLFKILSLTGFMIFR